MATAFPGVWAGEQRWQRGSWGRRSVWGGGDLLCLRSLGGRDLQVSQGVWKGRWDPRVPPGVTAGDSLLREGLATTCSQVSREEFFLGTEVRQREGPVFWGQMSGYGEKDSW